MRGSVAILTVASAVVSFTACQDARLPTELNVAVANTKFVAPVALEFVSVSGERFTVAG